MPKTDSPAARRTSFALRALIMLLALLYIPSVAAVASSRRASGEGRLVQLTDRAWAWIAGDERSSNGALLVGDQAALLVDPGLTPGLVDDFLAAARRATDRPIRMAVLTHYHLEHALGIVCHRQREFSVVSHPWTRRMLAERGARALASFVATATGEKERARLAACRLVLPERTVAERHVFDLGSHRVEVFHPGPAHTRGDLAVWSAAEGVLVTGDLFLHDSSPSMGEGSALGWVAALDRLAALQPKYVIPGHFAVGGSEAMGRFRNYLGAVIETARAGLAQGLTVDQIGDRATFPEYQDFLQYPQYGATFAGNARAVAAELASHPAPRGEMAGFRTLATLKVGNNPHQIAFSADGKTAYVAAAGSDRVTQMDVGSYRVAGTLAVEATPLGVSVLPRGQGLLVTQFAADAILRYGAGNGSPEGRLVTGPGPSLITGPLPDGDYLISAERANKLWVLDGEGFRLQRSFPTGRRPFPPAATSDGRLAFVPNFDDGTVSVVDLWNQRVLEAVPVGEHPSGGTVLPGEIEYAVAVRGENRVAFINTASHQVVDEISEGIGDSPFSVVLSVDGRLAFVNNTASHDVSVVALPERRVVARVPVGEIPIVMAVHPSGQTLWVSSEGSHEVTVLEIPPRWRSAAETSAAAEGGENSTEVAVLGMIHSRHRTSRSWGLAQVRETIRRYKPDAVCAEIPPDRWQRIWKDYVERDLIEDDRVLLFPEYTDVLLPLAVEMGFEIIPCAGWTREMSDLRQARIHQFETDAAWSQQNAEYQKLTEEAQAHAAELLGDGDDPRVIHSDLYDRLTEEELSIYDRYLNDWIGPGGWTNINESHMKLIDRAIRSHRGKRLLITFGAGHKYWILRRLRARDDVQLREIIPYLPPAAGQLPLPGGKSWLRLPRSLPEPPPTSR
ncbi:MAG: MBL fold metallo-hydrolase [Acidobacteriota bacterium]